LGVLTSNTIQSLRLLESAMRRGKRRVKGGRGSFASRIGRKVQTKGVRKEGPGRNRGGALSSKGEKERPHFNAEGNEGSQTENL